MVRVRDCSTYRLWATRNTRIKDQSITPQMNYKSILESYVLHHCILALVPRHLGLHQSRNWFTTRCCGIGRTMPQRKVLYLVRIALKPFFLQVSDDGFCAQGVSDTPALGSVESQPISRPDSVVLPRRMECDGTLLRARNHPYAESR